MTRSRILWGLLAALAVALIAPELRAAVLTSPGNRGYFIPTLPGQGLGSTNASGATGEIFNNQTTGAANTAVTTTFTQGTGTAWRIVSIAAYCSAGSASLTITDASTTIWSTPAATITTTFVSFTWPVPLMLVGAAPAVTLGACGAGNTGTLIIQGANF